MAPTVSIALPAALAFMAAAAPFLVEAQVPEPQTVRHAMQRAAKFYDESVSVRGGYVYHYTLDLQTRWGEGLATQHQVWVQPPGTPTVGLAMLDAHRATGDPFYLDAATRAAEILAFGQLRSGGWTNAIDIARMPKQRPFPGANRQKDGNSSLDDGQTQTALRLMMHVDSALNFEHKAIHESAMQGLRALLNAQFPNGAFPQVWRKPNDVPFEFDSTTLAAQYPDYDWRTEGRIKEYWDMYTLNDNVAGYVAETLHDAAKIYKSEVCSEALRKLGDFLVLAQMPEPQPGWAQQYNYRMQPIWARRFEPPGVSGDESQEAIHTLLRIAEWTGEEKYLAPVPKALAYLQRSLLPDGQLARYYELKTNRPLYMNRHGKQYFLTYDDSNLPSHYGWKASPRLNELQAEYERVQAGRPTALDQEPLKKKAARILSELDSQGRWVSRYKSGARLVGQPKFPPGAQYLSSQVFAENLTTLADYLRSLE